MLCRNADELHVTSYSPDGANDQTGSRTRATETSNSLYTVLDGEDCISRTTFTFCPVTFVYCVPKMSLRGAIKKFCNLPIKKLTYYIVYCTAICLAIPSTGWKANYLSAG